MAKKEKQTQENINQTAESVEQTQETANGAETIIDDSSSVIDKKNEEIAALDDRYKRLVAEFDNFKKRTIKEKENIYIDSVCDVVTEILPILDNLERALEAFENKESGEYKGVEMIQKQTLDIFAKIGVEQIKALGENFNPERHNAVMHVDDDSVADNTVVEEFQKGYSYKDKVIRYSMVKVAN